jgi:hypothetical protein
MKKQSEKQPVVKKKLVINTETIRNLTATELAKVAGGCVPPPTGSHANENNCP